MTVEVRPNAGDADEERRGPARRAHEALVREGVLVPLHGRASPGFTWEQCDLAAMVEGAFGEVVDPALLTGAVRDRWFAKLAPDYNPFDGDRHYGLAGFWILAQGEIAGIVALDFAEWSRSMRLVSLYVLPSHRRRGLATRVVREVYSACTAAGIPSLRLATHWTWQRPLRLYLKLGMYVVLWKRDITLSLGLDLPPWRCRFDGDRATFEVLRDSVWETLIRARHDGERLRWREDPRLRAAWRSGDGPWVAVAHYGPSTFATVLALAGWPLIRSRRQWQRRYDGADIGGPDSLAYKITIFETCLRHRGWLVDTPAIPGLEALTRGLRAQYLRDLQRD